MVAGGLAARARGVGSFRMQRLDRRAPGLDTLRGAAVLAVLCWHYLNNTSVLRTPALGIFQDLTSLLFYGVDLFFVLSGFLIGSSLMATKGSSGFFRSYFARRFSRIVPLYAAWFAAFLLMLAIGPRGGAFPWLLQLDGIPLLSYFTFTQNFFALTSWGPAWLAITWTLAIEMQFYVLAAMVIYCLPIRYVGLFCLAVIVTCEALRQTGVFTNQAAIVLTPSRLDAPFMGVLCAALWRLDVLRGFFLKHSVGLRVVAVTLITIYYVNAAFALTHPLLPLSGFSQNAILFGFATLAFAGSRAVAPAGVRALRWCGVRCYGIYLFHVGLLGLASHILFKLPPNVFAPGMGWPAVAAAALATFALAWASWRYFEKPIIDSASAWAGRYAQTPPIMSEPPVPLNA
jgi:peptidoglycan/LPS O-acetylase OafA/YrhL